jgi:hypothetical protein
MTTKCYSWLRPQFSLHMLLLAVTAFAIGFPIWYRWPYEEVIQLDASGQQLVQRATTWQRQWGGGGLRHGPQRIIIDGKTFSVTSYENGRKHGPFIDFTLIDDSTGCAAVVTSQPATIGQYVDDEKDGVWTEIVGDEKTVTTWHHGKQVQ